MWATCSGGATWQPAQATRLLGFLRGQGIDSYVDQYTLDGAPIGSSHSTSMVAMNGYAALIVPPETGRDFVAEVWELEVPQGVWRYYDGMLYLLSLLGLSGNLRVSF